MQKNILTLATGRPSYVNMAVNLARSFIWWHKNSTIEFQIVTDQPQYIPEDLFDKVRIITIKPGQFGNGFSGKLSLDLLISDGQTLFIDSDCLIFGSLEKLFKKFSGHPVSVIGGYISEGEWFGDIKKVCCQFGIQHLPKFNGGIYYLEKGKKCSEVYGTARELEKKYDEIGFVRLRSQPNDEVIMALAMELHDQKPIMDDGSILSDPQACPGGYKIDVINGNRYLINPPLPHPRHQSWYPFEVVSPLIFHFLGYYTTHYPYLRETYRLKMALSNQLNWFTQLCAKLMIEYPGRTRTFLKDILRPAYHRVAGYRKIKASDR